MTRIIIGICCIFLLSGCGGSGNETLREVNVEKFIFSLSDAYVSVPPGLIENKQLANKILAAYKIPSAESPQFEQNLLVTRSDLPPELNDEQFRTLNAQKLSAELAGYQPGSQEIVSFACGERDIEGLLVLFRLQDPRYTTSQEIWMAQYQFVERQKGYIISAAYMNQKDQQQFRRLIRSMRCGVLSENTTG